jgi:hypothetical protein
MIEVEKVETTIIGNFVNHPHQIQIWFNNIDYMKENDILVILLKRLAKICNIFILN